MPTELKLRRLDLIEPELSYKIVVELKKGDRINRRHAAQILAYLKTTNLKLGLLVYFGNSGVSFKRIINK